MNQSTSHENEVMEKEVFEKLHKEVNLGALIGILSVLALLIATYFEVFLKVAEI